MVASLAIYKPKTHKSLTAFTQRRQEGFLAALGDGKGPAALFSRCTPLLIVKESVDTCSTQGLALREQNPLGLLPGGGGRCGGNACALATFPCVTVTERHLVKKLGFQVSGGKSGLQEFPWLRGVCLRLPSVLLNTEGFLQVAAAGQSGGTVPLCGRDPGTHGLDPIGSPALGRAVLPPRPGSGPGWGRPSRYRGPSARFRVASAALRHVVLLRPQPAPDVATPEANDGRPCAAPRNKR